MSYAIFARPGEITPFSQSIYQMLHKTILLGIDTDPIHDDIQVRITGRAIIRASRLLLPNEASEYLDRENLVHFSICLILFMKIKDAETTIPYRTMIECTYNHWEQRLYFPELTERLRPIIDDLDKIYIKTKKGRSKHE